VILRRKNNALIPVAILVETAYPEIRRSIAACQYVRSVSRVSAGLVYRE